VCYFAEKTEMKIEEKYRNQLKNLRDNIHLLSNYSIDSAENKNWNQINRNRILIALFNDWKSSDYEIVDFLFNEEKKLRQSNLETDKYEVDVLYLASYILTKFNNIEDIWKFIDSKTTDFDSSIGFDTEYLLSFGVERLINYLKETKNPNKELVIKLIGNNSLKPNFTQEEIDEWKIFKHQYFSVFEFPIKDEIDFSFQAKEYEHLENIFPNWFEQKKTWSENQNLTSIAICKEMNLDELRLESLKNYNCKFSNSARIKMNKAEITELEKKLNITILNKLNL
jgi:hypothetical protein